MSRSPMQEAALQPGVQAILCAAAELFAKANYDSVSMAEIAAQAGVCKANIFHHFESKEALYLRVLGEACKDHAEFTEALLDQELGSVEKLRRLVLFEFRDMFSHEQRTQLMIREILNAGDGKGRLLAEQVFQRNFKAVAALFAQGVAHGELRADLDPGVAAWMLAASNMMYFQNRDFVRHFKDFRYGRDPEAYAAQAFETLLRGMIAPTAAPRRKAAPSSKPGTSKP